MERNRKTNKQTNKKFGCWRKFCKGTYLKKGKKSDRKETVKGNRIGQKTE
jgi:hypothetical protein